MRNSLALHRLHAPKTQQRSKFGVVPPWVIVMYNSVFFNNCVHHPNEKKKEVDKFCIDCLQSFCSHCLPSHAFHKHIKVAFLLQKSPTIFNPLFLIASIME
ncbi:hypothetical protein Golax_010621 [Gossypium laxum]|uniref:B box-type domain-containing protein n=1 Tax=Gossypium laxum TaxID=34288 RepID=A0A7J8ZIA0_9ROSI|nr:hypothetical protein [Gossypium laxum]